MGIDHVHVYVHTQARSTCIFKVELQLWSQLTASHAHPTSTAGAFSLLKFALQPEEQEEEA